MFGTDKEMTTDELIALLRDNVVKDYDPVLQAYEVRHFKKVIVISPITAVDVG